MMIVSVTYFRGHPIRSVIWVGEKNFQSSNFEYSGRKGVFMKNAIKVENVLDCHDWWGWMDKQNWKKLAQKKWIKVEIDDSCVHEKNWRLDGLRMNLHRVSGKSWKVYVKEVFIIILRLNKNKWNYIS